MLLLLLLASFLSLVALIRRAGPVEDVAAAALQDSAAAAAGGDRCGRIGIGACARVVIFRGRGGTRTRPGGGGGEQPWLDIYLIPSIDTISTAMTLTCRILLNVLVGLSSFLQVLRSKLEYF